MFLLKLSGEIFDSFCALTESGKKILNSLKEHMFEKQSEGIGIVIGGGNRVRGKNFERKEKNYADELGRLSSIMNGVSLKKELGRIGINSKVFTHINLYENYNIKNVKKYLKKENKVAIFAGGLGTVGFVSTDLNAVIKALELDLQLIKITNVDGVYNKNPKDPQAFLMPEVSYDYLLKNQLDIMDLAALELAKQNNMKIKICGMDNFDQRNSGSIIV